MNMATPVSTPPTIVVIGAGVIGLSSALKLQAFLAQHAENFVADILLVAREWPAAIPGAPLMHSVDYASMWAGAHVRPIPATTPQLGREAEWLKQTVAEFEHIISTEPWAGVTRTPGVEFLEAPTKGYLLQTSDSFEKESGLRRYQKMPVSELPEGVALGFTYETFCVNPPLYCSNLLRKFILQGGKTLKRDLKSEIEAFNLRKDVLLVVNASGIGFGDPECFPTRGHTLVTNMVSATQTVTRQNRDGSSSFIVPRFFNGGTIVGGTKEPWDWSTEPTSSTRRRLLAAGLKLMEFAHTNDSKDGRSPSSPPAVVSDVVGRRPTRHGGTRVELEKRALPAAMDRGESAHIIHAYGAGGRGFETSWGVATDVAGLAERLISTSHVSL